MKELSIEKKARRYDEAIEIAKEINNEQRAQPFNVMTRVFPELKESEDEKIRQWIVDELKDSLHSIQSLYSGDYDHRDEQDKVREDYLKISIAWLEKQGEHTKFRESIQIGDKVTRNKDGMLVNLSQLNRVAKKDEKQCQTFTNKDVDDVFLKDMSDAKKEQDEQILAWEEDELTRNAIINTLIDLVEMYYSGYSDKSVKNRLLNFLKSLKDRLQPKQEWSEEDEEILKELTKFIPYHFTAHSYNQYYNWAISHRPQPHWKPSGEQIEALEHSLGDYNIKIFEDRYEILKSLYNDLKKL